MKACLLLISILYFSVACHAQNQKDKEAVKKSIIAFQDDFNDGSFKKANSYSTTDWEHINPGGGIDKGRDKVLETVRAVHQTFLKGVTMRIETMDIRFITPKVAIADVIHQVDTYTTPDNVTHANERHMKTYVLVKKNGNWLIAQDQNTVIQNFNPAAN